MQVAAQSKLEQKALVWYQDQVLALIPFVVPLHHRHYTMKDPDAEAQCYKKQWV